MFLFFLRKKAPAEFFFFSVSSVFCSGAVEDELEDIVSTAERVLKGLELKRGQLERQGHAATKH